MFYRLVSSVRELLEKDTSNLLVTSVQVYGIRSLQMRNIQCNGFNEFSFYRLQGASFVVSSSVQDLQLTFTKLLIQQNTNRGQVWHEAVKDVA